MRVYFLFLFTILLFNTGFGQEVNIKSKTEDKAEKLEKMHPAAFYEKASELYKDSLYDDASFLFYLGQLRYRYYLASNPKVKSSQDGALSAALNATVGQVINEYLGKDPDKWVAIIDLVLTWDSSHDYKYYSKQKNISKHEEILEGLKKLKTHIIQNKDMLLNKDK